MAQVSAAPIDMAAAAALDRLWAQAEEADLESFPVVLLDLPAHVALRLDVRRVSRVMFRVVAGLRPRGLPLWWVREKFQAMGLPVPIAEAIERHFSHHRLCRLSGGEFRAIVAPGDWTRLAAEKAS